MSTPAHGFQKQRLQRDAWLIANRVPVNQRKAAVHEHLQRLSEMLAALAKAKL